MLLRTVWLEGRSAEDVSRDVDACGPVAEEAARGVIQALAEVFGFREVSMTRDPDGMGASVWVRYGDLAEAYRLRWEFTAEKAMLFGDWKMTVGSLPAFTGGWEVSP